MCDVYCISATIHKWEMWPERPINKWPTRVVAKKSPTFESQQRTRGWRPRIKVSFLYFFCHMFLYCSATIIIKNKLKTNRQFQFTHRVYFFWWQCREINQSATRIKIFLVYGKFSVEKEFFGIGTFISRSHGYGPHKRSPNTKVLK